MKRKWVLILNIGVMAAILLFVILYSSHENEERYRRQVNAFENTASAMERVTENYLVGEQQICDVWAHYINVKDYTMDEAVSFIRASHVMPTASAHILYADSLTGFSTRPNQLTGAYDVSYEGTGVLGDAS